MAYGIQTFDEHGNMLTDISTRLARLIGEVVVSSNGSISGIDWGSGTPFAIQIPSGGFYELTAFVPAVSISGDTLSWAYDPASSGPDRMPHRIIYGVY